MSTNDEKYKPSAKIIEEISHSVLSDGEEKAVVAVPEIDGHVPRIAEEQVIELSGANTQVAVDHIKDTLDTLKDLLDDLKKLAPASQQGFLFQTAAMIAKTRIEGSNMLAALESSPKKVSEENRGGARSNHLHLNVTSAQFGEFIASQVKKAKNDK